MLRSLLAGLVCTAIFISPVVTTAWAQSGDTAERTTAAKKKDSGSHDAGKESGKTAKKLTPQQQKMKECGAKWQDEKKAKNVKGREAYRKFLSTCLKKA